jgi:hypothetical protein
VVFAAQLLLRIRSERGEFFSESPCFHEFDVLASNYVGGAVKLAFSFTGIVGVAIACCIAGQVMAGDAASSGPSKASQLSSAKVDQQIDQAAAPGTGSSTDLDARVNDLEATRSAIDQKNPPTVSLSVSGWVAQQVQINGKQ